MAGAGSQPRHELGSIYHFLNARFDAVPRRELRNCMVWACRKNESTVFGGEVLSAAFSQAFRVRASAGMVTAGNLVIGVGIQPYLQPQVKRLLCRLVIPGDELFSAGRLAVHQRLLNVNAGLLGLFREPRTARSALAASAASTMTASCSFVAGLTT